MVKTFHVHHSNVWIHQADIYSCSVCIHYNLKEDYLSMYKQNFEISVLG